ncbi:DNA mismatch repair protein MutL [Clavulina sp. PMI_390]|nr:DNA mismatch repair protein MutL [Clavulina sp. PMI_390]
MEEEEDGQNVPGPKPIRRLEQSLVNRIAAGEIIHRPSSALKEILENSLDAGSKVIRVTVKDGGMKLLQIEDNGSGIRKADLPILCERFTTSKLQKFSDLQSIATYGFRGEALASISFVSHLTVTTKTKDDACAWKLSYADGKPVPAKTGQSAEAKPCAGNDGTLLQVEDLFYNTPTRLSALRSGSDEYSRILDVVSRYAIHNPQVAFSCKKTGSATPDISTPGSSQIPTTIRLLHGGAVAQELIHVPMSSHSGLRKRRRPDSSSEDGVSDGGDVESEQDEADPNDVQWAAEAYVTSANYHVKKMTFLLFINHRSVESTRIKRAVESVYNAILPKGSFPFVYLSLEIDPACVDVNVHPTKREVHFIDEEKIISSVALKIQRALAARDQSRTFEYQTLLIGPTDPKSQGKASTPASRDRGSKFREKSSARDQEDDTNTSNPHGHTIPKTRVIYPQHKVRGATQHDRTLDSMFLPVPKSSSSTSPSSNVASAAATPRKDKGKGKEIVDSECFLQSVLDLRADIAKQRHGELSEILSDMTLVGIVDMPKSVALIQHSTRLYLIDYSALSCELFYQLGVRQFGDFGRIHLEPSPSITDLIELAVACEEGIYDAGLTVGGVVQKISKLLISQREMLDEYFAINITEDGKLESLPILLNNYTPNFDRLPLFLMRLGPQVNWTEEKACFDTLLRELAYFYIPTPLPLPPTTETSSPDETQQDGDDEETQRWQIQHVLIPALRSFLVPSKALIKAKAAVQVASLPDLYRVFERC